MISRRHWIDGLDAADTPALIAERLLAISYEELADRRAQDPGLRRIATLARCLATLILAPSMLPRDSEILDESDWLGRFGAASQWPACEPSVVAGAFGLSCALGATLKAGVGATAMLRATDALDELPRKEDVFAPNDPELFALGFRVYKLVPTVCDIRLTWIMLAMTREGTLEDHTLGGSSVGWMRLARAPSEDVDNEEILRGLVLKQVVESLAETLTSRPRVRAPLDFSDLPELAAGTPATVELHGGRERAAHAFQRRLTVFFRSFNGLVVPARPGEPLPDIYCELPDGDFALIDAKSCAGRGYALPQSDADALRRYVEQAPRLLPKGRRVRAVLLVGPQAAVSLGARLAKLEGAVGCPVRFATAAQLVRFRDLHPGGPLEGLLDALRASPHVLRDGWWQPVVEWAQGENERLEEYVRRGLR